MIRVFVFGDNISFGKDLPIMESRPNLLQKHIFSKVDGLYVYNLSVPGNSSKELLIRIEDEIHHRITDFYNKDDINIAIISMGINDSKGIGSNKNVYTSQKLFYKNIKVIINLLKELNFIIIINGILPINERRCDLLKREGLYFSNKMIDKYNNILRESSKDEGLYFIDSVDMCFNRSDYLLDGLNLSISGHKRYLNYFLEKVGNFIDFMPGYSVMKYLYKLSDDDMIALKKELISVSRLKDVNNLFLGSFFNKIPDVFVTGICLRRDILGITLNSFYQIMMPILLGKKFSKSVAIILPIKEEILLHPENEIGYLDVATTLKKIINNISRISGVKVTIIDTVTPRYENIIKKNMKYIKLSSSEYNNMYNMSLKNTDKKYSEERILIIRRELSINSYDSLSEIFGKLNFCNVMDLEQLKFNLYLKKLNDNKDNLNYIGFLPLPNGFGTKSLSKSKDEDLICLGYDKDYYKKIINDILTINIYNSFFSSIKEFDYNKGDVFSIISDLKKIYLDE